MRKTRRQKGSVKRVRRPGGREEADMGAGTRTAVGCPAPWRRFRLTAKPHVCAPLAESDARCSEWRDGVEVRN